MEWERWTWSSILEDVCKDKALKVRLIIEYEGYDGIDFGLRADAKNAAGAALQGHLAKLADSLLHGTQVGTQTAADFLAKDNNKVLTKLLQRDSACCVIVEKTERFWAIVGQFVSPLQATDRSTSDCLAGLLREFGPKCGTAAEMADRKVRLTTTDAYLANARAERINNSLRPGWDHLGHFCHAHKLATAQEKAMLLLDPLISWCISLAKSLEPAGEMGRLRQCFKTLLRSGHTIIDTLPPRDSQETAYKNFILDTFLGRSPRTATMRALLLRGAPGDWRKTDTFQIFIPEGSTLEDELKWCEDFFVSCLAGVQIYLFKRARWSGATKTMNQIGIFMAIHHLLQKVFLLWKTTWHKDEALEHVPAPFLQLMGMDKQGVVQNERPDGAFAGATMDWKAIQAASNAAYRKKAGQGLEEPEELLKDMITMRIVLTPFSDYQNDEFDYNSAEGEVKRLAQVINQKPQDIPTFFQNEKRWPLLTAACGTLDQNFMDKLATLPPDMQAVPAHWKTLRTNNRLFIVLSRAGAEIELLLGRVHRRRMDYAVFRLLVDDSEELLAFFDTACESWKGAWASNFFKAFRTNLRGPLPMLELALLVFFGRTNTSRLECLNSSIRRLLQLVGLHTKAPTIETLSTQFVLSRFRLNATRDTRPSGLRKERSKRKRRKRNQLNLKKPRQEMKKQTRRKESKVVKRRGGGGAFRAFVRKRCKNIGWKAMKELATEYRNLPEAEKNLLRAEGRQATLRHRSGENAFEETRNANTIAQKALERINDGVINMGRIPTAEDVEEMRAMSTDQFLQFTLETKADKRVHDYVDAELNHRAAVTVKAWRESSSSRSAANDFLTAVRHFAGNGSVAASPTPPIGGLGTVVVWRGALRSLMPRMVALLDTKEFQNLRLAILQAWKLKHVLRNHADYEPFEEAKPPKKPSCRAALVCLCGDRGDKRYAWHCQFMQGLKKTFPGKAGKKQVDSSVVVCKVKTWDENDEEATLQDTWLHLAITEWSPANIGFRQLRYVGTNAIGNDVLSGMDKYPVLWDFIEGLDMSWFAVVVFYEMHSSGRPIPRLDGRTIEVTRKGEELAIRPKGHNKSAAAKAKAARKAVQRAWQDELHEFSESAEDSGPDDHMDVDDEPVDEDGDPLYPMGDLDDGMEPSSVDGEGTSVVGAPSAPSSKSSDTSEKSVDPIAVAVDPDPDPDEKPHVVEEPNDSDSSHSSSSKRSHSVDLFYSENSSSSSSSETPEGQPPLPPPPDPRPDVIGLREAFDRERMMGRARRDGMLVENGWIVYDEKRDDFIATCWGCHVRCTKTKSAHGRRPRWETKPAQGRPLGFLVAWLAKGHAFEDQAAHGELDAISFADRLAARARLPALADAPDLATMRGHERPQRSAEGIEPLECP